MWNVCGSYIRFLLAQKTNLVQHNRFHMVSQQVCEVLSQHTLSATLLTEYNCLMRLRMEPDSQQFNKIMYLQINSSFVRIKYHIVFGNFTEQMLLTRGPIINISWTRWEEIKSDTRLSWYLVLMYGEATWLESESFPLATWTAQKKTFSVILLHLDSHSWQMFKTNYKFLCENIYL